MSVDTKICPKCDSAIINDEICSNCGTFSKEPLSDDSSKKKDDKEKRSLFEKFASTEPSVSQNLDDNVKTGVENLFSPGLTVYALLFLLIVIGGVAYWRFIYFIPSNFISSLVLSSENIRKDLEDEDTSKIPLAIFDKNELTLNLSVDLKEGNFDKTDLVRFAPLDTGFMLYAFNILGVFSSYVDGEKLEELMKVLDISEDDFNVYFSQGFVLFFPDDSLNNWGFAIGVNDSKFIEDKLDILAKNYGNYYVDLLTFSVNGDGESKVIEKKLEVEDSESNDAKLNVEDEYFLLVSNSKEYLDQMKEASEGNLSNLKNDAKFVAAKSNLPQVGQVFMYKQSKVIWSEFSAWVGSKFEYEGLEKVLTEIDSSGILFYSKGGKLKIATGS